LVAKDYILGIVFIDRFLCWVKINFLLWGFFFTIRKLFFTLGNFFHTAQDLKIHAWYFIMCFGHTWVSQPGYSLPLSISANSLSATQFIVPANPSAQFGLVGKVFEPFLFGSIFNILRRYQYYGYFFTHLLIIFTPIGKTGF
jgi:hypothetical protein